MASTSTISMTESRAVVRTPKNLFDQNHDILTDSPKLPPLATCLLSAHPYSDIYSHPRGRAAAAGGSCDGPHPLVPTPRQPIPCKAVQANADRSLIRRPEEGETRCLIRQLSSRVARWSFISCSIIIDTSPPTRTATQSPEFVRKSCRGTAGWDWRRLLCADLSLARASEPSGAECRAARLVAGKSENRPSRSEPPRRHGVQSVMGRGSGGSMRPPVGQATRSSGVSCTRWADSTCSNRRQGARPSRAATTDGTNELTTIGRGPSRRASDLRSMHVPDSITY